MRFAICNEIYRDWPLADAFRHAARAGYDAVEIAPFTISRYVTDIADSRRREIRKEASRCGLAISGVHWVLAQTEGLHLTHPDAAVRAKTARYFVELVDFCADLGGRFIIVGSPRQRSLEAGITTEQGAAFARGVFRDAVRLAEDRSITICLEPLSTAETNFVTSAAAAVEFADSLGSPAMRMMLDVKAMCSESKPIPQIIRESAARVAYFHANDANLKGPGFGSVDFVPIAQALRDIGYEGWVSVEVFDFAEGADVIATRSLEYLRRCFGGPGA